MPDKDRKTVKSKPKKEKKISVEVLEHAFIKAVEIVLDLSRHIQPARLVPLLLPPLPTQPK